MKKLMLANAVLLAGAFALPELSSGHGGTYHGPGDTVPPGGGGGGGSGPPPTTGGPSGPSAPPGNGPSSGGPVGPSNPGGPSGGKPVSGTGGPPQQGADLTTWDFWWEFNKQPYLNLKSHVHSAGTFTGDAYHYLGFGQKDEERDTLAPSEETIRQKIVPVLIETLQTERNNDILTGAMVALAKIGDVKDEAGESRFEKIIREFLADPTQEVSETAAVALGILGNPASVPALVDLATDSQDGRKLIGNESEVPLRTRAFATYGLGLIGYRTNAPEKRAEIVGVLQGLLESDRMATRDVKVAALIAMGLVPIDHIGSAPEGESELDPTASRMQQIEYVTRFFRDERANHFLIRAHAPRTLAQLCEGAPRELGEGVARMLTKYVGRKGSSYEFQIRQSATLALGQLGDADAGGVDQEIRDALVSAAKDSNQQAKHFSMIALAQTAQRRGQDENPFAATPEVRSYLVKNVARGKSRVRSWAAVSLGVLGHGLAGAGESLNADASTALRMSLSKALSAQDSGAYCIGAGLRRDLESRDQVFDKMMNGGDDTARGYAAVALGLMNDTQSIEAIHDVIKRSKYRPDLLRQAAIALGLLGDKQAVPDLIEMLQESRSLSSQASIAGALGFIGDVRSVQPLVEMLVDEHEQYTDRARAFCAVALGIVADKEALPWNTKIGVDINYRANTQTLTDPGGTGILDIL